MYICFKTYGISHVLTIKSSYIVILQNSRRAEDIIKNDLNYDDNEQGESDPVIDGNDQVCKTTGFLLFATANNHLLQLTITIIMIKITKNSKQPGKNLIQERNVDFLSVTIFLP